MRTEPDLGSASGAVVAAVARDSGHNMSKPLREAITLLTGLGIDGDAHAGARVQHRSRVERNPVTPNLRQVHLLHRELFEELAAAGFAVTPGLLGENITTSGIDLLALPTGARLRIGEDAVVEITGLRNPCYQLDDLMPGLMKATLDRDANGNLIRKAGVMSIVVAGGTVRPGDSITIELPPEPHSALELV